jgi:hypothetical protein
VGTGSRLEAEFERGSRPTRTDRTERRTWRRQRGECSLAAFLQDSADGADNADIAGTATQVAAELEPDARVIGSGHTRYDIACRHQHRRRAKAALQSMLLGKRPAQRRHDGIVVEAFDGSDRGAIAHHA